MKVLDTTMAGRRTHGASSSAKPENASPVAYSLLLWGEYV